MLGDPKKGYVRTLVKMVVLKGHGSRGKHRLMDA